MSSIQLAEYLGFALNDAQRHAFRYLERAGQRFCVEFGTDNAVENARLHWRARRKKRR